MVKREGGSQEDAISRIRERMDSDQKRYNKLYGISLEDMSPYNMIIETDSLTAVEVADMVEKALNKREG